MNSVKALVIFASLALIFVIKSTQAEEPAQDDSSEEDLFIGIVPDKVRLVLSPQQFVRSRFGDAVADQRQQLVHHTHQRSRHEHSDRATEEAVERTKLIVPKSTEATKQPPKIRPRFKVN